MNSGDADEEAEGGVGYGFEVVGHYHDEILTLVDYDSPLGVDELVECMTRLPKWAAGMPCTAPRPRRPRPMNAAGRSTTSTG